MSRDVTVSLRYYALKIHPEIESQDNCMSVFIMRLTKVIIKCILSYRTISFPKLNAVSEIDSFMWVPQWGNVLFEICFSRKIFTDRNDDELFAK